jgi:hypothetical protein
VKLLRLGDRFVNLDQVTDVTVEADSLRLRLAVWGEGDQVEIQVTGPGTADVLRWLQDNREELPGAAEDNTTVETPGRRN